jgi:hypothetical protein
MADEPREDADEALDEDEALPSHGEAYPPLDFNTFVLSLSTSALMHLGEAVHPVTGQSEVDLPLAKQTVDLITLLEEKTKGNLTGEEERLLSQVLYDLRMRYLAAVKKASK